MTDRTTIRLSSEANAVLDSWAEREHRTRANLIETIVYQGVLVHVADGRIAENLDAADKVGRRRTL